MAGCRLKAGMTEERVSDAVQRSKTDIRATHSPQIAFDICRINRQIILSNDKIFIFW
ncbi:hypothetical protein AGR7A_Cc20013 [Agrobacterium deltaense NCPPB 1641]|uniref:Uncharacterized protein n=1 Tax=Agrobacterium deltaense NCPPB 1641 TaxID=1183425 RepID=A0A1S7TKI7_9HYPH|nr:hypothetical protein AGR7A_Cc20013 [Agrobacterium deltaense NCPPB 1641]